MKRVDRRGPGSPPRRPLALWAGLGLLMVWLAGGASASGGTALAWLGRALRGMAHWYTQTPGWGRMSWAGLAVCGVFGIGLVVERMIRLRPRRVLPAGFAERLLERLRNGRLDRLKGLDLCAMNPSPAAAVALAALERWGRPAADLERAVALATRIETDRLWRRVGTLRRIAVLCPLLGLLGTLASAAQVLGALGPDPNPQAWGPALAAGLQPLMAGVALAVALLAAYDGLVARVEQLAAALARLGAATADGVAMAPAAGRLAGPHALAQAGLAHDESRGARVDPTPAAQADGGGPHARPRP